MAGSIEDSLRKNVEKIELDGLEDGAQRKDDVPQESQENLQFTMVYSMSGEMLKEFMSNGTIPPMIMEYLVYVIEAEISSPEGIYCAAVC